MPQPYAGAAVLLLSGTSAYAAAPAAASNCGFLLLRTVRLLPSDHGLLQLGHADK